MTASLAPSTRTVTSTWTVASESVSAPPQEQLASEKAKTHRLDSNAWKVATPLAVNRASGAMFTLVVP